MTDANDEGWSTMAALQRDRKNLLRQHRIQHNHGESDEDAVTRAAQSSRWSDELKKQVLHDLRELRRKIKTEKAAAASFTAADHSLETYNSWLTGLGLDAVDTLGKAR